MAGHENGQQAWLSAKLSAYPPEQRADAAQVLACQMAGHEQVAFENPFTLADLAVIDDATLCEALHRVGDRPTSLLSRAFAGASEELMRRVVSCYSDQAAARSFAAPPRSPSGEDSAASARRRILDALFWELTYWKTPELYDELTEGERLHPGIIRLLSPWLRNATVLDAGAGCGRATFACLHAGAAHIDAVEPSPGLLNLLRRKLDEDPLGTQVTPLSGRFAALPLPDDSVRVALACSAFVAEPARAAEQALAELRRVTQPAGLIVIICPRPQDFAWLSTHGFTYVALPIAPKMSVRFRSRESALRVAHHFYTRRSAVLEYLQRHHTARVPYNLLGISPPHDYCWLRVE